MWRIIFLSFVLVAITNVRAVAGESTSGLYFAVSQKIVVLEVTEKSVSLTETIDCITQRLENSDYETSDKYQGLVFSSPLSLLTQGKETPFFTALPSISVTGGGRAELEEFNPEESGAVYAIRVTFLKGSVPKRCEITIVCHKEIRADVSLDLVYRWVKRNPKPVVMGHPIDWGPYELRVNCDKLHIISLKKGSGWVEASFGKASVDLEGSDSIELGIVPRSKDDPIAKIGRLENEGKP